MTSYPNADAVLIALIKRFKPSVSAADVVAQLEIHPDYPNLLALNDVLNNFGLSSSAYRITKDELAQVPCPFIAYTGRAGTEFLLVTQMNDSQVTLTDQQRANYSMKRSAFADIFDGVVLVPDEDNAIQTASASPVTFEGLGFKLAVALLFVCLAGFLVVHPAVFTRWQAGVEALLKAAGVAVSVLLLVQSIDKNNPLVQTLCGGGSKNNCNAILTSKAAKVFDWLSWSEVGFFYFTGTFLFLLFSDGSLAELQLLALFNIISLPYTFYSIYYQARVARQWCVLCCTVQALLWLEFIPLVTSLTQPVVIPTVQQVIGLMVCLALPIAAWVLLKPVLLKAQQVQPLKQQLRRFKYNTELFNAMLKEQPKYSLPAPEWSIVLGSDEANNVITMVSNPYCQPCSTAHKALEEWLNFSDDNQARIVFTAHNTDNDIKTPVVRHLMALNALPDKTIVRRALHDWYEQKQKDFKDWAKAYPVQLDESGFHSLEKQKAWCEIAEVKATPTLLVNGHRLPDLYRLADIKYMVQ